MLRHVFLFATLASILAAQEYRATLTGRVTDPSGAAVPNAAIVATKSDTNSKFHTVSGADGFYTLPQLTPGAYSLSATAKGFKSYIQSGITLGTDQRISQDVQLTLGDTSQSVTVEADATCGMLTVPTSSIVVRSNTRSIRGEPLESSTNTRP